MSYTGGMMVPVETVNFFVWQPCNMRCLFCYATFRDVRAQVLPDGHLTRSEATRVVVLLAEAGFQKITFVGGEPLLCPWLPELIATAKQGGMTTGIVTNGSLLTDDIIAKLRGILDWVAISIDSAKNESLLAVGRVTARKPMPAHQYLALCRRITVSGIKLKINTVVTQVNSREDLSKLIINARPLRWKILQVLPIEGQNTGSVEHLLISDEQFDEFVERHRRVERYGITMVPERNEDMTDSYALVDPAGRFFDNSSGAYRYSDSILSSGVHSAIGQVNISRQKFLARGGKYDW